MAGKTIEIKPTWKFAARGVITCVETNNTQMTKATLKNLKDIIYQMADVADAHVELWEEYEAELNKGVGKLLKKKIKGAK